MTTERHVIPADDGWQVEKPDAKRPSARAATRAEAIAVADRIVANAGGGRVVVHGDGGAEEEVRTVDADGGSGTRHPGHRAARATTRRNSTTLSLPLVGSVQLPPPEQLAYLGGVTTLVALGIVEWPIAAVLGVGHLLAATRGNKVLADFGEALEEA
jgi:hypothetical protein